MAGNFADKALIGGVWYWAGGPYSGQRVDATPANAGDLTPYLTPSYAQQATQQPAQQPVWTQPSQPVAQAQMPAWASSQPSTLPRMPFQDVLSGARAGGGFNPANAFGAGKETLPSLQRWNRLAPSEQQGYQGYLENELGVNSQDVMSQMNKLRPNGVGAAPRWTGAF